MPWPTHPDGSNKRIGDMTPDERAAVLPTYIAPGVVFGNHAAFGWRIKGLASSLAQIDYAESVLNAATINPNKHHCRIGRITLKG